MSNVVQVTVLFFASAREAAGGISQTTIEFETPPPPLPQQQQQQQHDDGQQQHDDEQTLAVVTTTTLRHKLASMFPKLSTLVLDEDNLTLALNEEYVEPGNVVNLKTGDTVALIPPISGG